MLERQANEINCLSTFLEKLESTAPAPTASTKSKKKFPDAFSGGQSELRRFLDSCKTYLLSVPSQFLLDRNKILFTVSLLKGSAYLWFSDHLKDPDFENDPLLRDWSEFERAITNIYGERDERVKAGAKLSTLRQTKDITSYTSTLVQLCAILGFNEAAKIQHFRDGLKPEIRNLMITSIAVQDFDQLVSIASAAEAALIRSKENWECCDRSG